MVSPLQVFGNEWLWIIVLVVIFLFGSKKLPELARAFGKAMGEFQKARTEVEREMRQASSTAYTPPRPPTTATPATPQQGEAERLRKAAQDLGIDVQGKTDEQLKEEIRKVLSK